jgi:general secretion pathway protein M
MADAPLTARAAQAFSRLTDSEKRLVALLGVVVILLMLVGLTLLMSAQVDKRKKRVAMRNDEIGQLEVLKERYEEAVQAEKRSEQRMKQSGGQSLFSTIQRAVTEVGLSVPDLQEKRTQVKDSEVSEITVDVVVKDLSVDKLHALLEKFEGKRGENAVKVTKLKVKTRFDNPEMLEATMTVSSWKGSDKPATDKKPGGAP